MVRLNQIASRCPEDKVQTPEFQTTAVSDYSKIITLIQMICSSSI